MQATTLSPRSLQSLELQISAEVARKQKEIFGDESVVATQGSSLYEELDRTIDSLISRYPAAENGSKFINSFCIVCPTLNVNLTHFNKIFKEAVPGSLFLDEVGKTIDFGPLQDALLGSFTTTNNRLTVTNIRFKPGSELRPNEHSQLGKTNKKIIGINAQTTFGAIDTNPALKKTELIADVTFGDLIKVKNMIIPLETLGDDETTELIINLPTYTTKISYDGTIALENGAVCNVEDLIGPQPVQWINNKYSVAVPFVA